MSAPAKGSYIKMMQLLRLSKGIGVLSRTCLSLLWLTMTLGVNHLAYANTANQAYLDNLMQIIKPPQSHIGVMIKDLQTNRLIYRHNPHTLALPASTQKLLTAVSAISVLGEEFRFTTGLYTNGNIVDGALMGDLYFLFSGDPTLDRVHLQMLLNALTDKEVTHIQGQVVIVGNSHSQLQAPGWVWDDLGICFAAPVSSFVIGKNCINAILKPRLATYDGLLTAPTYLPVQLTSDAVFDKDFSEQFCELSLIKRGDNRFHITGCHPGDRQLRLAVAIDNPSKFATDTIAQLLSSKQISYDSPILIKETPPQNLKLISNHYSAELKELIKPMLLDSDNLISDALLKQVGQQVYGVPGSFTNGVAGMKRVLAVKGVNIASAQLSDGSGLSRYNLLSPDQLMQVLSLIVSSEQFIPILNALPIAGVSGTLRNKAHFNDPKLKGRLMAKTGSMQGVANLAGFIHDKQNNPRYAFVIVENGLSPAAKEAQVAPFSALLLQGVIDNQGGLVSALTVPSTNGAVPEGSAILNNELQTQELSSTIAR